MRFHSTQSPVAAIVGPKSGGSPRRVW
jgi:hypothetical protein